MAAKKLFCIGNPLLDISADVDQAFLDKYGVTLNNAILCEEKHLPVFADLVANHSPQYIAGGATQNTARVCQWQTNVAGAVSYAGSIGKDEFGQKLKDAAAADGLTTLYKENEGVATGTCAVLINGGERSLMANLAAAEKYTIDHTESAPVQAAIKAADFYYIAGFVLTHSADSIMHVCKHSHENGKTMIMNCSAPFLFQVPPFLAAFKEAWEYLDIVVGNESEAEVMGQAFGFSETDVKGIALAAAKMPKKNGDKKRMVVITQGALSTIVATPDGVEEFPVPSGVKVVDTNGAGDAFVGGFLSQLITGKDIAECVRGGNYGANAIIQQSGCKCPGVPKFQWC